ncbi:hypothetical protein YE0028 [Yersinia enterocolitica subsp. enterocolitica 8081]|uniref:Uncharacterized protein n=1 Tax=Yersinia enterocolitica serotype O:8 / biotype 1B (strain NCTC 13174 / 8081) TaxID=393305 RepID=A1JHU0_YERE8|nr:hypothetical protein YE0028 [Yersinia enterocolitica subsp. enterocolitica 8081]
MHTDYQQTPMIWHKWGVWKVGIDFAIDFMTQFSMNN